MAITFPRTDILLTVPFADQKFKPVSRQELSRTAFGRPYGKDFGSAIWVAECTTVPLEHDVALDYEAMLHSLDGVINNFSLGDLRRQFPRAYPDGVWPVGPPPNTGVIHTLDANNKAMRIWNQPPGYILSRGDYLSFNYGSPSSRALHQVMETVTVAGDGLSPLFEVRPHIRPGAVVGDVVILNNARGLFVLEPNSIDSRIQDGLFTVISFKAVQDL